MHNFPKQQARANSERMLLNAGWTVQNYMAFDPAASIGTGSSTQGPQSRSCSRLVNFPPTLAEQTRIVAEVERRLSVMEELEAVIATNLQRATRLRQSILQKAFTGEFLQGDHEP